MKEAISHLHDIILHEACHLLPLMTPGILKSITNDPLGTWTANQLQRFHHIVRLAIFNTRVSILFILTNNNHIHQRMFGINERKIRDTRAHIGIEAKGCTCYDIQALVTTTLWSSHRCLEENLCTT